MFSKFEELSKIEKLMVGIALGIFVSSIGLHSTYKELFMGEKIKKEDVIATVESASDNTRRKAPDSFEFQNIKDNDVLANGDYVYAGEGSQLLVKFVNGPRLMIGEQSLIVLREIDGDPDLKIEQGALSGSFTDGDEIEIVTEKEAVILNGEKDSQFSVSYRQGRGLEVGSFDRNIRVQYDGKEVNLRNQTATISKASGIQVKEGAGSMDGKVKDGPSQAAAPEARMPTGLAIDTPKSAERITLKPPYPQANHVFIHQTGGNIPIYPKLQCVGDCVLKLSIDGKKVVSKTFKRDMVPIVYLKVKPGIEAKMSWEFSDGGQSTSGSFSVLKNNEVNFKKAFQAKHPVEVMN